MSAVISEDTIEQIIIQEFVDLGYTYLNGGDISPEGISQEREFDEVVLKLRLQSAIAKLNSNVPFEAQEEALKKVLRTDNPNLFQNNYTFHKYLTDGVDVEYRKGDRIVGDKVWLIFHDLSDHGNAVMTLNPIIASNVGINSVE
jgi:type I restriction enzyme R subunit